MGVENSAEEPPPDDHPNKSALGETRDCILRRCDSPCQKIGLLKRLNSMNDFEGMSDWQTEILLLEAKYVKLMSEHMTLRNLVLDYLHSQGVMIEGKTSYEHAQQDSYENLQKLLGKMANSDLTRASMVSKLIGSSENQAPPAA
jgi:hypothetical protein